ncbi:MAG: hypothetical protein NT058_00885, partial [Candidatus Portnoybacteria bacterium]|nr:hypothetical protein [Candidatus Portnoybacteria bacterium]
SLFVLKLNQDDKKIFNHILGFYCLFFQWSTKSVCRRNSHSARTNKCQNFAIDLVFYFVRHRRRRY